MVPGAPSVLAQSKAGCPNLLQAQGVQEQTAAPAAPLLLLQAVPNPWLTTGWYCLCLIPLFRTCALC